MPNDLWKNKPTQAHLRKLFADETPLTDARTAQRAKLDDPGAERERRELAAAITISRYGEKPLDRRIDETLDEPGERQITARWLNDDIAKWIAQVSQCGWHWADCQPDDLAGIEWKSEFAYFVYRHLA